MTATFSQIAMRCILSVILVPRYGIYGVCASVGTGWVLMVVYSSYNCIHYFRKKQLTIEENDAIIFQVERMIDIVCDANVAQSVEQRFRKPQVKGSSPFVGCFEV